MTNLRDDDASGLEGPPLFREDVPPFDAAGGPRLSAHSVDDFLTWASTVPHGDVNVIRRRIADARRDRDLLQALVRELRKLPVQDVGRHGLLLSTIGELKEGAAAESLIGFIWQDGQITVQFERGPQVSCSFDADGDEILRARAAEMLCYLGSDEAIQATLRIAAEHPVSFVRAAAIDAYMFNAGDSEEAAKRLIDTVAESDRWRIGLPRLTRDMDPHSFEDAIASFYDRYSDDRPPIPSQGSPASPEERSWQRSDTERGD